MTTTQAAVEFFCEHAGWGYHPDRETPEEGRRRGAEQLAQAEQWLMEQPGHTVEWVEDQDYNPKDYDDEAQMPSRAYGCIVKANGEAQSLWGITFASKGERGNSPNGKPYARVVVAELALEMMPD